MAVEAGRWRLPPCEDLHSLLSRQRGCAEGVLPGVWGRLASGLRSVLEVAWLGVQG